MSLNTRPTSSSSHRQSLPPLSTAPSGPQSESPLSTTLPSPSDYFNAKKKYFCTQCDRGFTTSGHLARHVRGHKGEHNYKCSFPGCKTRCTRQDNLQQHYRSHTSPRPSRTRPRMTTQQKVIARDAPASSRRRTKSPPLPLIGEEPSAPNPYCITASPISSASVPFPPPPDTPPPLVDAWQSSQPWESVSGRLYSRSSPEISPFAPTHPSTIAPHSAAKVLHSLEASYTASPCHPVIQYVQDADTYAYPDAGHPPSPTSSSGGYMSSQLHPISLQSPYGYPAHYGLQHSGVSHAPSGMSAARISATSLAPLQGIPPPPLALSSGYGQEHQSSSMCTLVPLDASLSIAGYNTSQGGDKDVSSQGHSSRVTPVPAIIQCEPLKTDLLAPRFPLFYRHPRTSQNVSK